MIIDYVYDKNLLFDELEFLPLAITQATAYMCKNGITIAHTLKCIELAILQGWTCLDTVLLHMEEKKVRCSQS